MWKVVPDNLNTTTVIVIVVCNRHLAASVSAAC
jgi:hypothetical protein